MCLIWCTPLVWCLSRSKVNKGLPSPSLLAASSSDYPSFWYRAVSSSYFPPICSSSYVFFLTYCSLSLFLFLPFPLPVCLPISCFAPELSPQRSALPLLYSCFSCSLVGFVTCLFSWEPSEFLLSLPHPSKVLAPHIPYSFAVLHPWASFGASLPKHVCLPACLP